MTTSTITIVGGGLMGHGIAYLFAAAGHPVRVFDPDEAIRRSLPMRLGQIADLLEHDSGVAERIAVHDQLAAAAAGSDMVIEATPEKLTLKRKLFAEL